MPVGYREKDGRYTVTCDKPFCYLSIAVHTLPAATELDQHHVCPFINGTTKYAGSITMQLVEQMWAKADEAFAKLLEYNDTDNRDKSYHQGECRMAAELIAIFMTPHFKTGDEIVREIVKRQQMKAAGEPYETPGLGYRIYELPKDADKPREVKTAEARIAVPGKLSAEDISMIKFMKDTQPLKTIADLFDITMAEVGAVFRS